VITLNAAAGWLVGVFLTWAADYVPRFATSGRVVRACDVHETHLATVRVIAALAARRDLMRFPQAIWTNLATELVAAGVLAFLWSRPIPVLQSISLTLLCSLFILVAVVDFRYRLVLNVVVLPAMALTLVIRWLAPDTSLLAVLLGGAFGFAIFEMAGVIRPGELGAGDVKLATLVGLVFGFPDALWALLVAVMAGGIVTLVLLLSHRGHSKSLIPYAPFLSIGAMIALFYNPVALIFRSFIGH